jgi:hypothetical protein
MLLPLCILLNEHYEYKVNNEKKLMYRIFGGHKPSQTFSF